MRKGGEWDFKPVVLVDKRGIDAPGEEGLDDIHLKDPTYSQFSLTALYYN